MRDLNLNCPVVAFMYYCPACLSKLKGKEIINQKGLKLELICINGNCAQNGIPLYYKPPVVRLVHASLVSGSH